MVVDKIEGSCKWVIPDGYFPSTSSPGHYVSHEAICVLNPGQEDAELKITLYFEDRDPMRDFRSSCRGERTHHIRMDQIRDIHGNGVPQDVPYAMMVESSQPVIVQYSRLDTTQAEMGLATTIAYPL